MLHKLEAENYAARRAMCYELREAAEREHLMDNILFSDEAMFYICGIVNRHNCRIWGNERPDDTFEWQRDTPKAVVWVGITKQTVKGPFMFVENNVTGGMYLDILEQFLDTQLQKDGILGTVVYQQDGAPPHFALPVREYLNRKFPNRWIGRGSPRLLVTRFPDLTQWTFFCGVSSKTKSIERKFVIWQFWNNG